MSEECYSNMRLKGNLSSSDFSNGSWTKSSSVCINEWMNGIDLVLDFSK